MHTGTLGKTSRGGANRSFFKDTPSEQSFFGDTPSGSSGGAGFLAGRGAFTSEYGLRQPEPQ